MSRKIVIQSFRELTDLTDDEVKQIINDLFNPVKIKQVHKDNKYEKIDVLFEWHWGDEVEEQSVTLSVPSNDEGGILADFTLNGKDYFRYNQFLLAKGVNYYLKDNPYLEVHNESM